MITEIFLLKIVISILTVFALAVLAQKVSPKLAGMIAGYPTGTAISLFFFGLEISPQFASDSVAYNLIGVVATQIFVYSYYRSTLLFQKNSIFYSVIISLLSYFVVLYLLSFVHADLFIAVVLVSASTLFFIYLFRKLKEVRVEEKMKVGTHSLFAKALVATVIIIFITEIAKFVGPAWAGLLSSAPSTLLPLILIVHLTYKKEHVHSLIKNVPVGYVTLIFYSLAVSFLYPAYGVYIGTLISLIIATLVSLLVWHFSNQNHRNS